MKFCPECNSRMRIKQVEEGGSMVPMYVCIKCSYREPVDSSGTMAMIPEGAEPIKVIEEGSDITTMPTTEVICPKCGHGEAVWWMAQTRSGDEPPTQFFRCVKCNHTWRHYA